MNEFFIAGLVVIGTFLAIVEALKARFAPTEVPWVVLFNNPQYYGRTVRTKALSILFLWVLVSNVIIVSLALIIDGVYSHSYPRTLNPSPLSFILTGLFSLAIYHWLVRQTKRYTEEKISWESLRNTLANLPEPDGRKQRFQGIVQMLKHSSGSTLLRLVLNLVFLIPSLLYKEFYQWKTPIISACVLHLLNLYGIESILNFAEHDDCLPEERKKLDELAGRFARQAINRSVYAKEVLSIKLRYRKYYSLLSRIHAHTLAGKIHPQFDHQRISDRICLPSPVSGDLLLHGMRSRAQIIEVSKDGGGFFLKCMQSLDIGSTILFNDGDITVEGHVVHGNPIGYRGDLVCGSGICVRMEDGRDYLRCLC